MTDRSRTLNLQTIHPIKWPGKNPERGPKLLFFSGGTALRELSRALIGLTHNSVHIITPFDSGGSSKELRKAFDMPAVGDIRNRLLALADLRQPGITEVFGLFSHRLPQVAGRSELCEVLARMAEGRHPMTAATSGSNRRAICRHLHYFLDLKPESFDPRGASIGNLILAAGYLANDRKFEPVLSHFSEMLQVRGMVRPVVNANLHLAATLENGETVYGQHRITGKHHAPVEDRIRRIYLTDKSADHVCIDIKRETHRLISRADLICYPMGSFYSSLIANLLPRGIGTAITAADCPKIYVPSTGTDPEARGLNTADKVDLLLGYLKADNPDRIRTEQVLHSVVIDSRKRLARDEEDRIKAAGVQVMRYPLVSQDSAPHIDGKELAQVLIQMT